MDALEALFQIKGKVYVYAHNATYDLQFLRYDLHPLAERVGGEIFIIKPASKIISISIRTERTQLHLRDSSAKIPADLRSVGKMIGLPKLEGPDFVEGWSRSRDFTDPREWDYVVRDAAICATAMHSEHEAGMTAATASGDAWRHFKATMGPKKWGWLFPRMSFELDRVLRQAYWGGLNFSFHKGANRADGCPIRHDDVKSMYPWALGSNPMPYGKPTRSSEIPAPGVLFIAEMYAKFTLKKGKTPVFMFKQKIDCVMEDVEYGEYVTDFKHFHRLVMSSIDLDTYSDYYDIEIDWERPPTFYVYKQREGTFCSYI